MNRQPWTQAQVDKLIELYPNHHTAVVAKAVKYEMALLTCLNGGLVAVTKDELIGCEGAREFRR